MIDPVKNLIKLFIAIELYLKEVNPIIHKLFSLSNTLFIYLI